MTVSIVQTLAIIALAFFYGIEKWGPQVTYNMSILYAWLVGLILGDPVTGLQLGATVQLMSLGVAAIGGSSVPDYPTAAIIGTAVAVTSGQDQSVGLAMGIAVGMLGVQLDVMAKIANGFVARKSQAFAQAGEYRRMSGIMYLGPVFFGLTSAVPTAIVMLFGADAVNFILNVMPAWFTTGLSIAGGALPVIGMAMLLSFMPSKKFISFVIIGYVLAAYLGLSILPVALLGIAAAYEHYKTVVDGAPASAAVEGELEDE